MRKMKLAVAVIGIAVLPLLAIVITMINIISPMYEEAYVSGARKLVYTQAHSIDAEYQSSISDGKEISSSVTVRKLVENPKLILQSEFNNLSKNVMRYNSYILGVVITDNDYRVISSNLKDNCAFQVGEVIEGYELSENGKTQWARCRGSRGNEVYFLLIRNIYNADSEPIGKAVFICDSAAAIDMMSQARQYKTMSLMLMDSSGNLIVNPYNNVVHYSEVFDGPAAAEYFNSVVAGIGGKETNIDGKFRNQNGDTLFASASYVDAAGWAVIMTMNQSEVMGSFSGFLGNIWLTFTIITVGIIIIAIYFATKFLEPENQLAEMLNRRVKGDSTVRIPIERNDEFAEIQRSLNYIFLKMEDTEVRYSALMEITDNIVFEIDIDEDEVYMSSSFNSKYSFRPRTDKIEDSFFCNARVHKDDKERYNEDIKRLMSNENTRGIIQGEYRIKNIYGDFAWVLIRAHKIFDDSTGMISKVVGAILDIDREKRSEMKLLQRATYDNLTRLFNRESFTAACQQEFSMSSMRKSMCAVLFLDLDDFKGFNDNYGHACGDEVLKFVADTLKEVVSEGGFAGRIGGDEFVACFKDVKYVSQPGEAAKEIISLLAAGFDEVTTGKHFSINCSIGIAFYPDNGLSCNEVLQSADDAMYTVKKHGKSNFAYAGEKK